MSRVNLIIDDRSLTYRQGDTINARATWQLDREPKQIEARLFYFTKGRGARDVVVAATAAYDQLTRSGEWVFAIEIPKDVPSSYAGKLISLGWALEVVTGRSREADSQDIVISPTGQTLRLQREAE